MRIILLLTLLYSFVECHYVWQWLKSDGDIIMWNRRGEDTVEQACHNHGRPVNNVAMCAKGSLGRKCLSVYEENDCSGNRHEMATYFNGAYCAPEFEKNTNFHLRETLPFYARSIRTYNC
ncbi:unnamed protein product [Cunninghamella echinulata]